MREAVIGEEVCDSGVRVQIEVVDEFLDRSNFGRWGRHYFEDFGEERGVPMVGGMNVSEGCMAGLLYVRLSNSLSKCCRGMLLMRQL